MLMEFGLGAANSTLYPNHALGGHSRLSPIPDTLEMGDSSRTHSLECDSANADNIGIADEAHFDDWEAPVGSLGVCSLTRQCEVHGTVSSEDLPPLDLDQFDASWNE